MNKIKNIFWATSGILVWTLVNLLLMSYLTSSIAVAPTARVSQKTTPCARTMLMNTVSELDGNITMWHFRDMNSVYAYTLWNGNVEVSAQIPCNRIDDVVQHEMMHIRQLEKFGTDFGLDYYGSHAYMELVADCASKFLGSEYTPYIDRIGGCTARALADARDLL